MKAIGSLRIPALCDFAQFAGAQDTPRPKILGWHIAIFAAESQNRALFYHGLSRFGRNPNSLSKPDGTPSMTFFKIKERQSIRAIPGEH